MKNDKRLKLSVIIPVYNAEDFLDFCITSVLKQSYDNFEVILVDDGSTDSSYSICKKYENIDSRICAFRQENRGAGAARNYGIKQAKGEYLTFVDSDDYIESNMFELLMKNYADNDYELIISGLLMEYYRDGFVEKSVAYGIEESIVCTRKQLFEFLEVKYPLICICGPCCKIYVKSIIDKYRIKFDENMVLGEDTLFNLNYLENINTIYFIKETMYHYRRINPESLFSSFRKDHIKYVIKVYDKMRNTMINSGCDSDMMKRFENMYLGQLIGQIQQFYIHYKDTTNKERKELIRTVAMNKYLREYEIFKLDSFRMKIFYLLLKLKKIGLIDIMFSCYYRIKKGGK